MTVVDPSFALKETLLADLRRARWQPGERLPTERQMCTDYRLGRATVRRALAEIKQLGLITQIVGSGTYVAKDAAARLDPAPILSPATLMEARLVLEPALIDLIVRHATAADFVALAQCCDRADGAQTLEAFEQCDSEFHLLLVRATHNGLLDGVFAQLSRARRTAEWDVLKQRSATPERRVAYGQQHRGLIASLRDRDAPQARAALMQHLTDVRDNMFH